MQSTWRPSSSTRWKPGTRLPAWHTTALRLIGTSHPTTTRWIAVAGMKDWLDRRRGRPGTGTGSRRTWISPSRLRPVSNGKGPERPRLRRRTQRRSPPHDTVASPPQDTAARAEERKPL